MHYWHLSLVVLTGATRMAVGGCVSVRASVTVADGAKGTSAGWEGFREVRPIQQQLLPLRIVHLSLEQGSLVHRELARGLVVTLAQR